MPQSLACNYVHIVFSTKNRTPWLIDVVRPDLYAYMSGIYANLQSPALAIGGIEDHVHALIRLTKNLALKDVVAEVKESSSKWLKTREGIAADFRWQGGYGAFSISASHVEPVRAYIRDQVAHHREEPFEEEMRRLLRKYGVEFDERYVWD